MPRTTVNKALRARPATSAVSAAAATRGGSGPMVGAPTAKDNGGTNTGNKLARALGTCGMGRFCE
jgi:hypothetical protein